MFFTTNTRSARMRSRRLTKRSIAMNARVFHHRCAFIIRSFFLEPLAPPFWSILLFLLFGYSILFLFMVQFIKLSSYCLHKRELIQCSTYFGAPCFSYYMVATYFPYFTLQLLLHIFVSQYLSFWSPMIQLLLDPLHDLKTV